MNRYSRQTILADFGVLGQELLGRARVLCVGAGGLGSPAAMYLAAAGVGTLGLVDGDRVDLSNLQRQVLFAENDVGRWKVEAAAERLRAMNAALEVRVHREFLSAENALDFFSDYDVVLDGTDNFAAKFLINDACVRLSLPMVYGSISQFEGQASVFWADRGPCYRCLHPAPPKSQIQNCAESGVLGGVAGVIGSLMAMEAIKVVLLKAGHAGHLRPLIGRLSVLDLATNETMTIKVPRRLNCAVCSCPPEQVRMLQIEAPACPVNPVPSVAESELREHLNGGSSLVVDVRESSEWHRGHLAGSIHFALSRLEAGESLEVAKNAPVIVLCQAGVRSKRAVQILTSRGFASVREFAPGVAGWSGELSQ